MSVGMTGALAHDDKTQAKHQKYDAIKVEEHAFGREGDPKKVSRTIKLDMTDALRFTPGEVTVKRGETVKFVVSNSGKRLHEMVLGTTGELREHAELMKKFPDMEHADANMAHVKPGQGRNRLAVHARPASTSSPASYRATTRPAWLERWSSNEHDAHTADCDCLAGNDAWTEAAPDARAHASVASIHEITSPGERSRRC